MAIPRPGTPAYQDAWRLAYWQGNASPADKKAVLGGWTPPVSAPPGGMYDPSLDMQLDAGRRGYEDLVFDSGLAGQRQAQDFGTAKDQQQTRFNWSSNDLDTRYNRGTEDYQRNTAELQRQFRLLGNRQGQQMRAYGVSRGGGALQAARKRQENQGREQGQMDLNYGRFSQDIGSQRDRLGTQNHWAMEGLGTQNHRFGENQTLQVDRAGRELMFSGLDTDAIKRFQAIAAGWRP